MKRTLSVLAMIFATHSYAATTSQGNAGENKPVIKKKNTVLSKDMKSSKVEKKFPVKVAVEPKDKPKSSQPLVENQMSLPVRFPQRLYHRNYIEVDPFYVNNQMIQSDINSGYANNLQIQTSRPSLLLYLNIKNYILNTNLSVSPKSSAANGSFSLGRLFSNGMELGVVSGINHVENVYGYGNLENGGTDSYFSVGSYFVYYPRSMRENLWQFYVDVSYLSIRQEAYVGGASSNLTNQMGVQTRARLKYSYRVQDDLYFAPSFQYTFAYTKDSGQYAMTREISDFQIIPFSIQFVLE